MFSIQTISLQFNSFLISGIYLFLGTLAIAIPFSIFDLLFLSKGADVGGIGSVFLYSLTGLLLTGVIMFFDLLFIRFLFKLQPTNKIYFISGVVSVSILIFVFAIFS